MAEKSYLWTTGGAGDGAATYTQADWSRIGKIFAATNKWEGVAPNYLNALAGTPSTNNVAINTGGAIVDGMPYNNDASVNVNIPSAVGGGNTRIDRIVLRANWTARTIRITRLAGTDASSPVAPAITQSSGSTYDIMLYQALVNTSGTVVLTDERVFAYVATADIADSAVTSNKIADSAVTTNKISNSNVTTAKIADANITSAKIADANVTTAKIADLNVTTAKIADLGVTAAKIGNGVVDDTKAGQRVLVLKKRQGGHASDWATGGTTDYTPSLVQAQGGTAIAVFSASQTASITVTFPVAFNRTPLVFVTPQSATNHFSIAIGSVAEASVVIYLRCEQGAITANIPVCWLGVGSV